jgi:hypothetical protein
MSHRKPLMGNARSEALLGLVAFAAGAYLLWDAYEGHGRTTPLILRPFLPV